MIFADFRTVSNNCTVCKTFILTFGLFGVLVEDLNVFCNLFHKTATADKLVNLKTASAMWTLLSLLDKPFPDAISASEFATAWTDDSVFYLAEADEALE